MWKKHKYGLLSFILMVGIFIVGIKLPDFADAAPTDKSGILTPVITVKQNGEDIPLPPAGQIDPNAKISVNVKFDVPVKAEHPGSPSTMYIEKGDIARFEIGTGIKLSPADTPVSVVINDTGTNKKIGTATFRNKTSNPADGIVMDFVFDGEDEVFEDFHDVKVSATATFELDTSGINPNLPHTSQTITVLGNTYNIKPISEELLIEKSGEVDYLHSCSVKWTILVTRTALGRGISLDGYKVVDDLLKTGKYVAGTFTVNGTAATPVYNESGKTLSYDFPAGATSPLKIEFNTAMNNGQFTEGYKTSNTVGLYKGADKLKTATAEVEWKPELGGKSAKEYDGFPYRKEGSDYYIDWEIVFNEKPYTLNGVTIKDELSQGDFGKVGQQFVSAKLEEWNGSAFVPMVPAVTWSSEPSGSTYNIGNINKKVKLTITTKLTEIVPGALNSYNKIKNGVTVRWAGNPTGAEFWAGAGIGENEIVKGATTKPGTNGGLYVDFDTEWTGYVKPRSSISSVNSYMYDCMIFDNTVITEHLKANPIPFTIKGRRTNATALRSGVDPRRIIPIHSRFLKYSGWNDNNPANLDYEVYEMYVGTKHIGDILEVRGFTTNDANKNRFKFKAKQTALNILMKGETAYNVLWFAQNNYVVESHELWPKYNPKLINKQAFTVEAARDLVTGGALAYSADKVNRDIFDDTAKKGRDNVDISYDKDDRSVIYRISVNAAGLNGIGTETGNIVVEDKLPVGWEFAPVRGTDKFLIYAGESYTDAGNADATVRAIGTPVTPPDFTHNITTNEAKFTFSNIDKPYVILLKARIQDPHMYINRKETVKNTASLGMKTELLKSEQNVEVDRRFLTKDYDDTMIADGSISWKIEYKPYPFITAPSKVILEDELGGGIELKRYAGTGELVLKDDNYKMVEGRHENGVFVQEGEPFSNEKLKEILEYDAANKKLKIKLPDKNKSYVFSYITDIKNKNVADKVENKVIVKEDTTDITAEAPKEYFIASAFGSGSMKPYNRMRIVKKGTDGVKLKGAEFELVPSGSAVGTKHTTNDNGEADFKHLLAGVYKLKEVTAPSGYVRDTREYLVTVSALAVGFDVEIDTQGNTKITSDKNVITIENVKIPPNSGGGGGGGTPPPPEGDKPLIDPKTPDPKESPKDKDKPKDKDNPDPEKPNDPEDPEEPEEPDTPDPTPDIPTYPINRTPDPNDPDSPDEIIVVGDDGTPLGRFIKKKKPDGKFEYINADDGTPLGGIKVVEDIPGKLPKTGSTDTALYYIAGVGFILAAGFTLKKRKEEQNL